jgi:APA family basic amino acid/polyamine antiporter
VTASITIVLGEYVGRLVPALASSIKAIAIAALLVFTLLHWLGLRVGSRAQKLMGFATALGFVALIAACFIFGRSNVANSTQVTTSVPATASAIFLALVLAFQSVIVTYDGWYGAIYFSEEDEDPTHNLPRALLSAVLVIIAIYMLVNLALLYVLPLSILVASQLAAADAAQAIFGARGGQIITALSFLSLLSVTNACFMETPRIMYGMGRDGLFTASATRVNDKGTPTTALFISALAAIIFVASGTFDKLVAITAFFYVVMYGSGFVALFVLRRRAPELARPFKAWGYPWTTLIVVALSLVFLVGVLISDRRNSVYALLMLALSYPVYRVVRRAKA